MASRIMSISYRFNTIQHHKKTLLLIPCQGLGKKRDHAGELSSRLEQQGTRNQHAHPTSSKRRHTSSLKVGSEVVLKTSTYPNKRNVAYATIRSTDPATIAGGIELGAEFTHVRIDESFLDNEELVREVAGCMTVGDAFSSGFLIAWPSAFIPKKDR